MRRSLALLAPGFLLLLLFPPSSLPGESGEWWLSEAEVAMIQGACGRARSYLEKAEALLPGDPRIPLYQGLCSFLEGEYGEAIPAFAQVVTVFPEVLLPYAYALMETKRTREAEELLKRIPAGEETQLLEIAQALVLLSSDPERGIAALNQIVRKYRELRGEVLYFRALVQMRLRQEEPAKTALRASYQLLREDPEGRTILRTLELLEGKGEANRHFYGDLYLDTAYHTNVTRVPEGGEKIHWFTETLKARGLYRTLTLPWHFSALLFLDQEIPLPAPEEVTRGTTTLVGSSLSLGYSLSKEETGHDLGLELEPHFSLLGSEPNELEIYARPRYILARSPDTLYKFFYEFGYRYGFPSQTDLPALPRVQDLLSLRTYQAFEQIQSHRLGVQLLQSRGNPRAYLTPLLSYRFETGPASSQRFHGPEFSLQGSWLPFLGVILQGGLQSAARLYGEPKHTDLLITSWLGAGFFVEEWKVVALAGGGYEGLFSSVLPYRNGFGFLRVGGYF